MKAEGADRSKIISTLFRRNREWTISVPMVLVMKDFGLSEQMRNLIICHIAGGIGGFLGVLLAVKGFAFV